MPEEAQQQQQEPDAGTAGETPESTPPQSQQLTPEQQAAEVEKLRAELKRVNRESADRRKRLEAFEVEDKKRQDAQLTEAQRLQAKLAEEQAARLRAETDLETERQRMAILTAAAAMNFHRPEQAYMLADLSGVERGEDGKYKGIEDALKALAKESPYLLRSASQSGGASSDATKRGGVAEGSALSEADVRARYGL